MAFRETKLQRRNVWCGICDTAWHHHSLRTILAARHEMHSICWTWIMAFRIQWLNWFTWSHWNTVGHLSRCSFFFLLSYLQILRFRAPFSIRYTHFKKQQQITCNFFEQYEHWALSSTKNEAFKICVHYYLVLLIGNKMQHAKVSRVAHLPIALCKQNSLLIHLNGLHDQLADCYCLFAACK